MVRKPATLRRVRTLKTREAAEMLGVSPNTLRAWAQRFDYPCPQRTTGQHRVYIYGEVAALRDALRAGLSISSAVSRAREALSGDTNVLVGALTAYELDRADAAMEATVALRPVERSVEEVLLPSMEQMVLRHGADSATWAFAARWAEGWLRRAHRLAPPPTRPLALLVGDATDDALDPDAIALRAFELFCARSGVRTLTLPVRRAVRVSEVVTAFGPQAVVLAGGGATDHDVARWAHQVRLVAGPVPVNLFRRGLPGEGVRSSALPDAPYDAHCHALAAAGPPSSAGPGRSEPARRFLREYETTSA